MTPLAALIERLKSFSAEDSYGCWITTLRPDSCGNIVFVYHNRRGSFGMHLRRALEETLGKKFPSNTWGVRTCLNPRCVHPQHRKFLPRLEASILREKVRKERKRVERAVEQNRVGAVSGGARPRPVS